MEVGGFLAVGMAAAAVVTGLAGTHLMPGLGHVEDHAVLVEGLEGEGLIGGNFGKEAGVGIAVRVEGLFAVFVELTDGNLTQDAEALVAMAAEKGRSAMAGDVCERFLNHDANGVDLAVVVEAVIAPLEPPVELHALVRADGGDAARDDLSAGGTFALIEAGGADEAIRSAFGKMGCILAVVAMGEECGLIDAVDSLVRDERGATARCSEDRF